MDCNIVREALSARIDGEREPVPAARVDEHLAACAQCRAWQESAVEQTLLLRRAAGRSQVAAVRPPPVEQRRPRIPSISWRRWALGTVGVVQVGVAAAQALGAHLGIADAHATGHVLNESTAWSAALGVVMLSAAIRPVLAGGLWWVLATFSVFLIGYEVIDTEHGLIGLDRPLSHLPVAVGALLAFLVWRRDRPMHGPGPDRTAATAAEDITLPAHASRGRRRSHLRPADDPAA